MMLKSFFRLACFLGCDFAIISEKSNQTSFCRPLDSGPQYTATGRKFLEKFSMVGGISNTVANYGFTVFDYALTRCAV